MTSDQAASKKAKWLRRTKYVLLAIVIVVPVIVFMQNIDERSEVQVLFWKSQPATMLLLLGAFVVGAAAGLLLAHTFRRKPK